MPTMSGETRELIEISERLSAQERTEVTDFARFLLEKHQDEAWERTIADPVTKPKLDAFLKESRAEPSEPLELDRL